ncbi:MAG: DUF4129 domain-containing protein [Gemmatimonadaceae bacterium]
MQSIAVGAAAGTPAAAIHDTVAAIVRQPGYDRSLRQSLADLFFRWLGETIERVFAAIEVPGARRIATALAVVLAVLTLARIVYAAQLRSDEDRPGARRVAGRRGSIVDPLGEAERLAAEGHFTDAAHALYRALLLRLSTRERLGLHPSKTSGEYARELRAAGSPAYTAFHRFGRRYDRVLFGRGACDAASYATLLGDARSLLEAHGPAGGEPRGRAA